MLALELGERLGRERHVAVGAHEGKGGRTLEHLFSSSAPAVGRDLRERVLHHPEARAGFPSFARSSAT